MKRQQSLAAPASERKQQQKQQQTPWLLVLLLLGLPLLGLVLGPGASMLGADDRDATISTSPLFIDQVAGERQYSGENVSLSLRDADLVEVLRSFAKLGDFNLLIQPGVHGKVTVELKDVPWDQAMAMILKMHGLGMDLERGTARVASIGELQRMVTEPPLESLAEAGKVRVEGVLEHVDARRLARLLSAPGADILSPVGRAWADRRTNQLTVEDHRLRLRTLAQVVARLDAPQSAFLDPSELADRFRQLWREAQGGDPSTP